MNAIIHPLVWETLGKRAEASGRSLAVIEAAVFDTAPDGLFDEIWYVYADPECRIRRLMESRGYSREKCERIIESQSSEEEVQGQMQPRHRQQRKLPGNGKTAKGDSLS